MFDLPRICCLALSCAVLGSVSATAADDTAAAMRVLKSNCLSCHSEQKKKGGLAMHTREALLRGGDNGAAIELGDPEKSELIASLSADADPHMPPKKQLAPEQIETLKRWVKNGAEWDAAAMLAPASKPREVQLAALPANFRPALALAISPDSKQLAVASGNEVLLYNVEGAEPALLSRASAQPDAVQSIAWSPDGQWLATGAFRRVVIWKVEGLTVEKQLTDGLTDRIAALRYVPDGKQLVIADGRIAETGTVRLAEVETAKIAASWEVHADTIFDLAVSGDGKLLATAGGDKLVKLWDLATRKEVGKLEGHTSQVLSVAFDADGKRLVSGGADQQIKVWDVQTHDRINSLGTHTAAINAVAWLPAGPTIFAVTNAGLVARYTDLATHSGGQTTETAKEKKLESAEVGLHGVAVSANGERVFAGTQDGRLLAWNKDGKLATKLALHEAAPSPKEAPSFLRDVLPVLSRAGCNAGNCHAKPDGQNGFRLTVFSYDPQADFRNITQDARGRRILAAAPEESLLLLKATETVPHEGGARFDQNSDAYRTVVAWIRAGMVFRGENEPTLAQLSVEPATRSYRKGESQELRVTARYSDGTTRDVTALAEFASNDKEIARVTEAGKVTAGKVTGQGVVVARFMGLVAGSNVNVPADRLLPESDYAALPVRNFIDERAYAQFRQLGLFPSEPCSDAEFLRRASLDTIGALPTAEEARAFLEDPAPDKRDKLIERLLAHPLYADYWANKWADLLRPNPDRAGVKSVYLLDQWLREVFRANRPYDQFVREIVTTQGNTHRFGPAVIYRDRREPADLTTMFSQVFLGVRLDCAKCHHHPNEKWGQDDFYQMAAFFGPVKQKGAGISAPISAGNETFYFSGGKSVKHPVTGAVMDPRPPDGPLVAAGENADPRRALAEWMTDAKNPFVAKAVANRIWAAFFGRGIVDPVDDFRISNPASNPALLDALGEELVRQKYNLKALMRTILRSHLYQLSAKPNDTNRADTRNFSRAYRRRLPAEVLADAVADVTGMATTYPGMPGSSRAIQAWTYKIDSATMDAFGRPNSSSDCPCERDVRPSIVQALHLMNSKQLQDKLASTDAAARVQKLAAGSQPPEEVVRELYLACYSRLPSDEEMKVASGAFSREGATRRAAIEDVLWSLLNSAEFVFNH